MNLSQPDPERGPDDSVLPASFHLWMGHSCRGRPESGNRCRRRQEGAFSQTCNLRPQLHWRGTNKEVEEKQTVTSEWGTQDSAALCGGGGAWATAASRTTPWPLLGGKQCLSPALT